MAWQHCIWVFEATIEPSFDWFVIKICDCGKTWQKFVEEKKEGRKKYDTEPILNIKYRGYILRKPRCKILILKAMSRFVPLCGKLPVREIYFQYIHSDTSWKSILKTTSWSWNEISFPYGVYTGYKVKVFLWSSFSLRLQLTKSLREDIWKKLVTKLNYIKPIGKHFLLFKFQKRTWRKKEDLVGAYKKPRKKKIKALV